MEALNHEARYRGEEAMARLAEARVCLLGAGAVGSNLADSLARQGIRRLRIIDRDRVESQNTATQVYLEDHVGSFKAEALKDHLFRATGAEIESIAKELTESNIRKLLRDPGLVIDGFDNSASRRLATEFCLARKIPCLHVGLNADYGEVIWNEDYRVPGDAEGDVCDYPLARNLVQLTTSVAAEAVVRYVLEGAKENYSVTLKDLKINREER